MPTHSARRRRALGPLACTLAAAALAVLPRPSLAQSQKAAGNDYTHADVMFMQMMIVHHAQAVVMSDWAPTHGASAGVKTLCARIAASQKDEIALMQHWLEARNQKAPDPLWMERAHKGPVVDPSAMHMPGMDMGNPPMMMSGMLTPAEMHTLDASRGVKFDSLYLVGMMKHHQGAVDMVADLFASPGSGQQSELFGFATDIDASQRAEIHRMQLMLDAIRSRSSH